MAIGNRVANEQGRLKLVVIASGENWSDALAGNSLAGLEKAPLLLVPKGITQAAAQLNFITEHLVPGGKIYLLGGLGAISDEYEKVLLGRGLSVTRLWGYEAADTALAIANKVMDDYEGEALFIVGDKTFADALSVSSYANINKIPILLTERDRLSGKIKEFISKQKSIKQIYIVRGNVVVSDKVEQQLNDLKQCSVRRLWGISKFDTNKAVFAEFQSYFNNNLLVAFASGDDFADALAGSAYTGYKKCFLFLLPQREELKADDIHFIGENFKSVDYIIFGGTGAINTDQENKIKLAIEI